MSLRLSSMRAAADAFEAWAVALVAPLRLLARRRCDEGRMRSLMVLRSGPCLAACLVLVGCQRMAAVDDAGVKHLVFRQSNSDSVVSGDCMNGCRPPRCKWDREVQRCFRACVRDSDCAAIEACVCPADGCSMKYIIDEMPGARVWVCVRRSEAWLRQHDAGEVR